MRMLMLGEEVKIDYFQSDIFSLGITMLYLAKLDLPSSIAEVYRNPQQLKQVVKSETCMPYSAGLIRLIRTMLKSDPSERPNIEDVLLKAIFSVSQQFDCLKEPEDYEKPKYLIIFAFPEYNKVKNSGIIDLLNLLAKKVVRLDAQFLPPNALLIFALYYKTVQRYDEYKAILEEDFFMCADTVDENAICRACRWSCLGIQYSEEGNLTESAAAFSRVLEFSDKLNNVDSKTRAKLYWMLGLGYLYQQKLEEAEQMLQLSLAAARALSNDNRAVALASMTLGLVYYMQNKYEIAEKICLRSISIFTNLFEDSDSRIAEAYLVLSTIYWKENKQQEFKEICVRLINVLREKHGDMNLKLAYQLCWLGLNLLICEKWTEAATALEQSISIIQKQDPECVNINTAQAYWTLGVVRNHQNRTKEAEAIFTKIVEISLRAPSFEGSFLAFVYYELGDTFIQQKRLDEAKTVLLEAVSLLQTAHGKEYNPTITHFYLRLTFVYSLQQKWADCEALLFKLTDICQIHIDKIGLEYILVYGNLAAILFCQRKIFEAEAVIVKGITIMDERFDEKNQQFPELYLILADIYYEQGRLPEAEIVYIYAIDKVKLLHDVNYPYLLHAYKQLVLIYSSQKKAQNVELFLRKLLDIFIKLNGEANQDVVHLYISLAIACHNLNRLEEEEQWILKAMKITRGLPAMQQIHAELEEQLKQIYYATKAIEIV